jgi:hypothetical protein
VDPGRSVVLRCDDRFKEGKQLGIRLMVDNLSPRADTLKYPAVFTEHPGSDDELPQALGTRVVLRLFCCLFLPVFCRCSFHTTSQSFYKPLASPSTSPSQVLMNASLPTGSRRIGHDPIMSMPSATILPSKYAYRRRLLQDCHLVCSFQYQTKSMLVTW